MKVLGAILCGGLSSRFGSNKAVAIAGDRTLFDLVRSALVPQVDHLLCCGPALDGVEGLPDRPSPGLGPLGGLAAALHAARIRGFDAVLSVPCDAPALPSDLRSRLDLGIPAFADRLPVIGLWPASLSPLLDAFILDGGKLSMRGWAKQAGATAVMLGEEIVNLNTPHDLEAWTSGGLPLSMAPQTSSG